MAEEEHARWEEVVTEKEVQLHGLQEGMEQLEVGLEQARRDILPQLRIHKVCTRPPLPVATPLSASCHLSRPSAEGECSTGEADQDHARGDAQNGVLR